MRRTWGRTACAAAVASLMALGAGCGSIDSPGSSGSPLWVLQGRILESAEADPGPANLRVALVWERHFYSGGLERIAQDVAITSEFPSRFSLELFDPPPEAAMHTSEELGEEFDGSDIRLAVAQILVYDDRNGSGTLDVLPSDAQDTVDYILGSAEDYMVVYVEGDPNGLVVGDVPFDSGLNLYQFGYDEDRGEWRSPEPLSLDSDIEITLENDVTMQYLMCDQPTDSDSAGGASASGGTSETSSNPETTSGGYEAPSPTDLGDPMMVPPDVEPIAPTIPTLPEDAVLMCHADGEGFTYEFREIEHDGGVCTTPTESVYTGIVRWEAEYGPHPADWPCD